MGHTPHDNMRNLVTPRPPYLALWGAVFDSAMLNGRAVFTHQHQDGVSKATLTNTPSTTACALAPDHPFGSAWPWSRENGWWNALHTFPICYIGSYHHTVVPNPGWDDPDHTLDVTLTEATSTSPTIITCTRSFTPTHHTLMRYHAWMASRPAW